MNLNYPNKIKVKHGDFLIGKQHLTTMNIRTFIHRGLQKTGRYGFLLLSLFFMIALRPFLEALVGVSLVADILFTCVLISGIYALNRKALIFRVSCLLVAIIIILKIAAHLLGIINSLHVLQIILSALFVTLMLIVIVKHLLVEQEVTGDLIMGGACAFVLLGFVWAHAYYLVEISYPDSFKAPEQLDDNLGDFIYYSFVTLTTLGYGDMVAVSKQARGLTILEAIVGQLYLAIMVARLVGLHAQNRNIS